MTPPHYKQFTDLAAGTAIRGNYYPPCPDPMKTLGIHAHSDANTMTIIHQGDVGGLQVARGDKWVGVRPIADGFAVNAGDMLQVQVFLLFRKVFVQPVSFPTERQLSELFVCFYVCGV